MRGKVHRIESISSLHIILHPNLTKNHNLWVVKTKRAPEGSNNTDIRFFVIIKKNKKKLLWTSVEN